MSDKAKDTINPLAYRGPRDSCLAYQQHTRARLNPMGRAYAKLFEGWAELAKEHERRYGSPIGEDYYTGEHWKAIGQAIDALLTCELGGWDPGSLNTNLREIMLANGVEVED